MPTTTQDYIPFPNVEARNQVHALVEVPLFVSALHLPRGVRVLEIGCGRGAALCALARHCLPARLAGLDVSREALAFAGERLAADAIEAEVTVGDARCMPFAEASFDVVVDFGTCYHIAHPEQALGEISRVLAPGGLFATETRLAQAVAHPLRPHRGLPWPSAPGLHLRRRLALWMAWERA